DAGAEVGRRDGGLLLLRRDVPQLRRGAGDRPPLPGRHLRPRLPSAARSRPRRDPQAPEEDREGAPVREGRLGPPVTEPAASAPRRGTPAPFPARLAEVARDAGATVAAGIEMPVIEASVATWGDLARALRDDPALRFDYLVSITATDEHPEEPRFRLVA